MKQPLRYGENSHQTAAFYQNALPVSYSIASAHQLHGKELSYNNIKDADAAIRIAREFTEPTVVALKHHAGSVVDGQLRKPINSLMKQIQLPFSEEFW